MPGIRDALVVDATATMAPAIGAPPALLVTRPDSDAGCADGLTIFVALDPVPPADLEGADEPSGDDELHASFHTSTNPTTRTRPTITARRTVRS